jgi:hypothetical protein
MVMSFFVEAGGFQRLLAEPTYLLAPLREHKLGPAG